MRCTRCCAVIVLAIANWSAAVGDETFTLEEAIAAMEDGNESLEAMRGTVRAAKGDAVAARMWDNPSLDVAYTRDVSGAPETIREYDFSVSQAFDVTGARTARFRSAVLEYRATQADYDGTLASRRFDVEAACIQLLAAFERLDVLREASDQVARITQIVRDRVENGAAPRYDAGRAGLSLADVMADVQQGQADLAGARGALGDAVGSGAARLRGRPVRDLMREATLGDEDELVKQGVETRADIVAARRRAQSATETVKATRRGRFPSVEISFGTDYGASPGETNLTAGVSLVLPILDRGQGSVPAAMARATSTEWEFRALETKVRQAVETAYRQLEQLRLAHRDYRDAGVAQNEKVLAQAEAAYLEGQSDILDLLDAVLSYRDARLRLLDLAQAARQGEVTLQRTVYAPGGASD